MIDEKKLIEEIKEAVNDDRYEGYVPATVLFEVVDMIREQPAVGEWILCSERLPEERINQITHDFYEYPVTAIFGDVTDVRYYKFGYGHWWLNGQCVDDYVVAWLPKPEPWKGEKKMEVEKDEE